MTDTVVKKLNEIADQIAGEDVEDAKTVAEGLVAIGNAFGGEGEDTESVVKALDYIKEHISGGGGGGSTHATVTFIGNVALEGNRNVANVYADVPADGIYSDEPMYRCEDLQGEVNENEISFRVLLSDRTALSGLSVHATGVGDYATLIPTSSTGGVTYEYIEEYEEYVFNITGDGTVTGTWQLR